MDDNKVTLLVLNRLFWFSMGSCLPLLTGCQIYQMRALVLFLLIKDLMCGLAMFVEIPMVYTMSISQWIQMHSGILGKISFDSLPGITGIWTDLCLVVPTFVLNGWESRETYIVGNSFGMRRESPGLTNMFTLALINFWGNLSNAGG